MSRFLLLRHLLASSGGGGAPPSNAIKLGMNLPMIKWWAGGFFWNDHFQAGESTTDAGNGYVSAADLDSDKWPIRVPSGGTYISRAFTPCQAGWVFDMSWDGNFAAQPTATVGTISNYDPVARTATFTFTGTNNQIPGIRYSISGTDTTNGTYPRHIKVVLHGSTGKYDPVVQAGITGAVAGGPVRVMDISDVNHNMDAFPANDAPWGGGTQAAPVFKLTNSNRNTPTGGSWSLNENTWQSDGIPIEELVAMCNAYNVDLWDNIHWNASPSYVQTRAAYVRDNLNQNLKYYAEISNEVWNNGFAVSAQSRQEGSAAYRTSGVDLPAVSGFGGFGISRYAEKIIEYLGYVKTQWNAGRTGGGATPTLIRVCAWATGANAAAVTNLMNYSPDGTNVLKNFIEAYSTAPYADGGAVTPALNSSYAGNGTNYFDPMSLDAANAWERAAAIKVAVEAMGKIYVGYESGPNVYSSSSTVSTQYFHDPVAYNFLMHYWAIGESAVPGCVINFYSYMGAIDSTNGTWGMIESMYQTLSTSYQYQAQIDYKAGKRKLIPLYGNLIAATGATVGTRVGSLWRRTPGSTVAITSTPAGAFSFADATANKLVVQVADASKFVSAGSISWSVTETDARDTIGSATTTGTCLVSASTILSPATSSVNYMIAADGQSLQHVQGPNALNTWFYANVARSDGYWEFTPSGLDGQNSVIIQIGLTATSNPISIWNDPHSVVWDMRGQVYINGSVVGTWSTYTALDNMDFYLSPGKKLYGRKNNGSWLGATGAGTVDPVSDVGGVDLTSVLAGTSGLFPAAQTYYAMSMACRFTNATFLHTKPTGANQWTVAGG